MTKNQEQQILNEVQYHKMLDCRIYAYIVDDKVIFSYVEPPRSLVKEFAVVRFGRIEQLIRYSGIGKKGGDGTEC